MWNVKSSEEQPETRELRSCYKSLLQRHLIIRFCKPRLGLLICWNVERAKCEAPRWKQDLKNCSVTETWLMSPWTTRKDLRGFESSLVRQRFSRPTKCEALGLMEWCLCLTKEIRETRHVGFENKANRWRPNIWSSWFAANSLKSQGMHRPINSLGMEQLECG